MSRARAIRGAAWPKPDIVLNSAGGMDTNPFTDAIVHGVWESPPPADLPGLNAAPTTQILETIAGLRTPGAVSQVFLLLGPPGIGKTHLLTRLRTRLGPDVLLAAATPPLTGGSAFRHILDRVASDLSQPLAGGHWDQLSALVGRALAGTDSPRRRPFLLIEELRQDPAAWTRRLNERLIDLEEQHSGIDTEALDRILRLPFEPAERQRITRRWLRGHSLGWADLESLGVDSGIEEETHALGVLATLGALGSAGAPLLLTFDNLESLARHPQSFDGFARTMVQLRREVPAALILLVSVQEIWEQQLAPRLPFEIRRGFADRTLVLEPPDLDEALAIAQLRAGNALLGRRPSSAGEAREPLLTRADVESLWADDPRPRAILRGLARRWDERTGKTPPARRAHTGLQACLGAALEATLKTLPAETAENRDDDDFPQELEDALAEVLGVLSRGLPARLTDVESTDLPKGLTVQFRLDGTTALIGVGDHVNGQAFAYWSRRFVELLDAARAREPETRGYLLRDESRPVPKTWVKSRANVDAIEALGGTLIRVTDRDRVVLQAVRSLLIQVSAGELEVDGMAVSQPQLEAALVAWPEIRSLPLLGSLLGSALRAPAPRMRAPSQARPSEPMLPAAPVSQANLETDDLPNILHGDAWLSRIPSTGGSPAPGPQGRRSVSPQLEQVVLAAVMELQLSSVAGIVERIRSEIPNADEASITQVLRSSEKVIQITDDFFAWASE